MINKTQKDKEIKEKIVTEKEKKRLRETKHRKVA